MSSKKNTFFGATIYYSTISRYYGQGNFSYFVIQPMIDDGEKADDYYTLALWAVDSGGAVMNGDQPIQLTANNHSIPAKKKVHFANGNLTNDQLKKMYESGTFDLGLNPIYYNGNNEYIAFEVFNANQITLTTLTTINPSPPATRS